MLEFLVLRGPVMYLKHMGTPATICPKSHIPGTFLTMCRFDGEQRKGEGGAKTAPRQAAESGGGSHPGGGAARMSGSPGAAAVGGVGSDGPCVSQGGPVCLVPAGEFFVCLILLFLFLFLV